MRRQALLDAVIAELQQSGIGDRSLRDIAASVGTSHRMLIHHFGSKQGLLTEVVRTIEADQRAFLETLDAPLDEQMAVMWQRLADPALRPAELLFFECYARASRGEQPFATLLPGLVDDWLDQAAALEGRTLTAPEAARVRARARVGLAVFRGLLLDLVGTGDRAGVDSALEVFISLAALDASSDGASRRSGRRSE